MGKKILVECLQSLIHEHAGKNLHFTLVMLIPTEPAVIDSYYNVVFSASWLDSYELKEAIDLMIKEIIRQIGTTDSPAFRKINCVNVIRSNGAFVNELTSAFTVSNDVVTIDNYYINGVLIERAFLLESHSSELQLLAEA